MSLFDKYVKAETMEDLEDEAKIVVESEMDEEEVIEAEGDEDETEERTAEDDEDVEEVVAEVADAVEEEMEESVEALRSYIRKHKLSHQASAVLLNRLNQAGILIANPFEGKFGKVRLNEREAQLVKAAFVGMVEATEDALAMAAKILASKGCTTRQGKALDRKLEKDGFVRSRVASPLPLNANVRKAEKAVSKTRRAQRRGLSI